MTLREACEFYSDIENITIRQMLNDIDLNCSMMFPYDKMEHELKELEEDVAKSGFGWGNLISDVLNESGDKNER